jgi:serine/threonine-protein kinase
MDPSPPAAVAPHGSLAYLVPGSRLGHFEVAEYVGGGGMGKVFRGIDTGLGRPVALKVLTREQAADPETLLRFKNEARNAARLNHDNIVQVYYVGEHNGLPFIAFEYVDGVNLRSLVEQRGPLPLAEAVSYTLQVAEALAHAAGQNVVHRDIKPSNVLITREGRAKLIDMGLARLQKMDDSAVDLTASGVTLGTFDYISPEQARDPRNADVRSDLYSLGCTLFYMLSGRPPFPEGTVLQKLLQHQGDDPPDVRAVRPDLPEEVSRVLRKMMAKDPRRRYQDPAKLILALLSLAESVGFKPVGSGQTIWLTPGPSQATLIEKHLPWLAPIAVLAGIVLVLHLLWSGATPTGSVPTALPLGSEETQAPASDRDRRPARPVSGDSSQTGQASHAAKPAAHAAGSGPVATAAKNPTVAAGTPRRDSDGPPPETTAGGTPGDHVSPGATSPPDAKGTSKEAGQTAASPPPAAAELLVTGAVEPDDADAPPFGPRRFRTLASACAAAHSGQTIEICFNGRREERPIQVSSPNVTVRAGEGFHPRIIFQPDGSDPAKCPRSMISLSGGELTLQDLSLELEVPRPVAAENWSLVQLSPGQSLKLNRCWLTIRNASNQQTAYHPDVAFVRVMGPMGMDPAIGDEVLPEPASLVLTDCVARGEATFLKSDGPQPLDLSWNNGLLATTERLFSAEGGEQSPRPGQGVRLQLDHLTADLHSGLCRLARSEYAPHQLPCRIQCARSMLFGSGKSPLVEQVAFASGDDSLAGISWDGRQNSYPGFLTFWRTQQLDDSPSKEMSFDAWKTHWRPEHESQPGAGPVGWSPPPADVSGPLNQRGPADYAPAADKTADRPIAGMILSRLPPPPWENDAAGEPTQPAQSPSPSGRGSG